MFVEVLTHWTFFSRSHTSSVSPLMGIEGRMVRPACVHPHVLRAELSEVPVDELDYRTHVTGTR
jgi:hypothetical protein